MSVAEFHVSTSRWFTILLGEAKVDDAYVVFAEVGIAPDNKILWFDISVDVVMEVHIFNCRKLKS